MLSLSGPNALLFLQLLIALVTMSEVKISAISIGFLVTNRVSLEEECLPSFEVLNCLLNLAASYLDDENKILLKEIPSFSAGNSFDSSPQLGNICLMVHVLNKISQFLPFMLTDAFLDVFIQSWPFRRGAISFVEVVSSGYHIQYLC